MRSQIPTILQNDLAAMIRQMVFFSGSGFRHSPNRSRSPRSDAGADSAGTNWAFTLACSAPGIVPHTCNHEQSAVSPAPPCASSPRDSVGCSPHAGPRTPL